MFFLSYCLHWLLDRTLWWVYLIPLLILSVSLAQKWWSANIENTSHISSFSQQGVSLICETLIWKYELICGWWFLCFISGSVVSVLKCLLQAFSNQETYSSQVLHIFVHKCDAAAAAAAAAAAVFLVCPGEGLCSMLSPLPSSCLSLWQIR